MATIRNGVNLDNIQQLVEAVKADAEVANVKFVANSTWQQGTKTEVTINNWYSAGQNAAREGREFKIAIDEPAQLGGADEAPNPAEVLAAGLCGCITAGIATNAALFGTDLEQIEVTVEVDFDIRGLLGLDRSVPSQAMNINYSVNLKGAGDREKLIKAKEVIDGKSPVKNTLANPISVTTSVNILEDTLDPVA